MTRPTFNGTPVPDPHAQLERAFIDEYLARRGQSYSSLPDLPEEDAKTLLQEASRYASGRLTELESRAHWIDEMHRAPGGTAQRR